MLLDVEVDGGDGGDVKVDGVDVVGKEVDVVDVVVVTIGTDVNLEMFLLRDI